MDNVTCIKLGNKKKQAINQKKIILTFFVKQTGPLMGKGMASLMKMKIQNFLYFALKMKNKNVFHCGLAPQLIS